MAKKFQITSKKTDRGFERFEFTDRYGEVCSIQESSLATDDAIWFGVNHASIEEVNLVEENGKKGAMARMHLTRDMVKDLLPILQFFADHGELPPTPTPPTKDR